MNLIEDLPFHRLGEVNPCDLSRKGRGELFQLDMLVLCLCRVRHFEFANCIPTPLKDVGEGEKDWSRGFKNINTSRYHYSGGTAGLVAD